MSGVTSCIFVCDSVFWEKLKYCSRWALYKYSEEAKPGCSVGATTQRCQKGVLKAKGVNSWARQCQGLILFVATRTVCPSTCYDLVWHFHRDGSDLKAGAFSMPYTSKNSGDRGSHFMPVRTAYRRGGVSYWLVLFFFFLFFSALVWVKQILFFL